VIGPTAGIPGVCGGGCLRLVFFVASLALARTVAAEIVRPQPAFKCNACHARNVDRPVLVPLPPSPTLLAQEEAVDEVRFTLAAQELVTGCVFCLAARALDARAELVDEQHMVSATLAQ
jgi:hypothetical protein